MPTASLAASVKFTPSRTVSAPKRLVDIGADEQAAVDAARGRVLQLPPSAQLYGWSLAPIGTLGSSALSTITRSSLYLLPGLALIHCAPMSGVGQTLAIGNFAPLDDADRGRDLEVAERLGDLRLVLGVGRRLEQFGADVEQRLRGAELLVPLPAGALFIAVGQLLRRSPVSGDL